MDACESARTRDAKDACKTKKTRRGERRGETKRRKKDKINKMHMSRETTIKTILLVFGTRPEAIKMALPRFHL